MFYLKKIEVFLVCWKYRIVFEELSRTLSESDIECSLRRISTGDVPQEPGCALGMTGRNWLKASAGENPGIPQGILWITDSAVLADWLQKAGYPVLVFLHEENSEKSFGECRYAFEAPGVPQAGYLDRIYRRFRRIPWDILETERCLIRETTEEDVEKFYRIYEDPSIVRYMENLYDDPEEERAYIREYTDKVYAFYEFGIWTVTEKDTGEVIGRAGICYREGYEDPELGFVIAVPWQGRGYATEVCSAILEYANEELGIHRILAFVQPENLVSLHVCGKLGLWESGRVSLQGTDYLVMCLERRGGPVHV